VIPDISSDLPDASKTCYEDLSLSSLLLHGNPDRYAKCEKGIEAISNVAFHAFRAGYCSITTIRLGCLVQLKATFDMASIPFSHFA
jgi:hypothetical protein